MHNKRVLYPSLALLVTTFTFALLFFIGILNSSVFMRLMQGPTASFYSLPAWLRYCLLHPMLLKTFARLGCSLSLLGSMLTLFLLLKTEPPNKAYGHLAGIGWAVLLLTGVFFGLALGGFLFPILPALVRGNPLGQLKTVFVMLLPTIPIFCAFFFVVITIPFSLIQIVGRFRASAPARQTPHVLQ